LASQVSFTRHPVLISFSSWKQLSCGGGRITSSPEREIRSSARLARCTYRNDAALPDDYEEISKLLHLPACDVMTIVGANKQHESAHLA
jgi:hypothetical protein